MTFHIKFGWDWPDEEMGDVALLYKERASDSDSRILLLEHTFRVENDLVLASDSFASTTSVNAHRPVADGTAFERTTAWPSPAVSSTKARTSAHLATLVSWSMCSTVRRRGLMVPDRERRLRG